MESAQASFRDGDNLCSVMQKIALASQGREEDVVYEDLNSSGLLFPITVTTLNLAENLEDFPCFNPADLIRALGQRDRMENIIGHCWETCRLEQSQGFPYTILLVEAEPVEPV